MILNFILLYFIKIHSLIIFNDDDDVDGVDVVVYPKQNDDLNKKLYFLLLNWYKNYYINLIIENIKVF